MGIPFFGSSRDTPEPQPHRGYFSLDERMGGRPDYDDWDARLDQVEWGVSAEERRRLRWFQRSYWRDRRWGWWIVRAVSATLLLFFLLLAWLVFTAPLSKSLQPIVPPEITLTAADGTPIARKGAVVDAPVRVAELPPHVQQAFVATEDRRFDSH